MADDPFPPRPAIAAAQREQLRLLIATVLPANPFYKKKYPRADFAATVSGLEEFCERFPFTTKEEIDRKSTRLNSSHRT